MHLPGVVPPPAAARLPPPAFYIEPTAVLGNVLREGLEEVWNGTRYRAFRARFESECPPQWCAGCGSKWNV